MQIIEENTNQCQIYGGVGVLVLCPVDVGHVADDRGHLVSCDLMTSDECLLQVVDYSCFHRMIYLHHRRYLQQNLIQIIDIGMRSDCELSIVTIWYL